MMAYQQDFVTCILHEGSPVREINGKVTLPFNSEYKVRLKNKSNVRAKARVWIDGRKVSNLGDFIIQPGQTFDLERFLDESMSSGNRFKFVPLSDSRVNDPTDSNNGFVKVEFYREQGFKIEFNRTFPIIPIINTPYINPEPSPDWYYTDTNTTGGKPTSDIYYIQSTHPTSETSTRISSCFVSDSCQTGATVEGSLSNQNFVEGDAFSTEITPITLTIKIQGPRAKKIIENRSLKNRPGIKFCGDCGSRRKRSDSFCRKCGWQFPAKRR